MSHRKGKKATTGRPQKRQTSKKKETGQPSEKQLKKDTDGDPNKDTTSAALDTGSLSPQFWRDRDKRSASSGGSHSRVGSASSDRVRVAQQSSVSARAGLNDTVMGDQCGVHDEETEQLSQSLKQVAVTEEQTGEEEQLSQSMRKFSLQEMDDDEEEHSTVQKKAGRPRTKSRSRRGQFIAGKEKAEERSHRKKASASGTTPSTRTSSRTTANQSSRSRSISSGRPLGSTEKKGFYSSHSGADYRAAFPAAEADQDDHEENREDEQNQWQKHRMASRQTGFKNENIALPDEAELKRYRVIGDRHRQRPIFDAVCFNCGELLWGRIGVRKFYMEDSRIDPDDKKNPPVKKMFTSVPLPYKNMDKQKKQTYGKFFCCRKCKEAKNTKQYFVGDPQTGKVVQPKELKNLTPEETGLTSLAHLYSRTFQKTNVPARQWKHSIGEYAVKRKREDKYFGMYGMMATAEENVPASHQKVKRAIQCLRKINPLYQEFYPLAESMYGHFSLTTSVPEAQEGIHRDKYGRSVKTSLESEKAALVYPFDVPDDLPQFFEDTTAGTANPIHPEAASTAEELKNLTKVNYRGSDLEMKAFPTLFPYGAGGYDPSAKNRLRPLEYHKARMCNLDRKFAQDQFYPFFCHDQRIKNNLFGYNMAVQARKKNRTEQLTTAAIKESVQSANPYDRYGKVVPGIIVGSRAYWSSRLLDLLEYAEKFGTPDYFFTMTQNDGWGELQATIKHGFGKAGPAFKTDLQWREEEPVESAVLHPTESTVAFFNRFDLFMRNVVYNRSGPLGTVKAHWRRVEFQARGAIHIHMVLWMDQKTKKEDAVTAEMPRGTKDGDKNLTQVLREMTRKYQMHKCVPNRCFKGPKGENLKTCKYGFPAPLRDSDGMDEFQVRWLYKRREDEDKLVVPFNLKIMLLLDCHTNLQRVTGAAWAMYLAKYITKVDTTVDMKLSENASDVEKFLRCRVTGRLEVELLTQQYALSRGSHEVQFLTTNLEPEFGILKKEKHLPEDQSSTDVFYDNTIQKYCDRPTACEDMTYPEYFQKMKISYDVKDRLEPDALDDDAAEIDDSTADGAESSVHHGTKMLFDQKKRPVKHRKKEILTRHKPYRAYGEDQEKFYEQKIVKNIKFRSIKWLLDEREKAGSFMELAAKWNLVTQGDDIVKSLKYSVGRGVPIESIRKLAEQLIDKGHLGQQEADEFFTQVKSMMPDLQAYRAALQDQQTSVIDEMADLGCLGVVQSQQRDLSLVKQSLTDSQLHLYNFVEQNLEHGIQLLMTICGPAGTGKSYMLDVLEALMKTKFKLSVQRMATTGIAAHLIRGCTVHHFFCMDANLRTKLEKGTPEQEVLTRTDVLVIDEMSMLDLETLHRIDGLCKRYSKRKDLDFGGKHVLLIGDPCQLPCIRTPIYQDAVYMSKFTVAILKDIKRQDDPALKKMLNEIRMGQVSKETDQLLRNHVKHPELQSCDDGISRLTPDMVDFQAPIMISRRDDRDWLNDRCMKKFGSSRGISSAALDLDEKNQPVDIVTKQYIQENHRERLPDNLDLKFGCRVMLVRNIDVPNGWTNGTLCTLVSAAGEDTLILRQLQKDIFLPVVKFRQTLKLNKLNSTVTRHQFPIMPAFAITVHKAQGMTLKKAQLFLCKHTFFASGQAYTALSRVKKLEDLVLYHYDKEAVFLDKAYRELWSWMERVNILQDHPTAEPVPDLVFQEERQAEGILEPEQMETIQDYRTRVEEKKRSSSRKRITWTELMNQTLLEIVEEEQDREDGVEWMEVLQKMRTAFPKVTWSFSCEKLRQHYSDLSRRHTKVDKQHMQWTSKMEELLLQCYRKVGLNQWDLIKQEFISVYGDVSLTTEAIRNKVRKLLEGKRTEQLSSLPRQRKLSFDLWTEKLSESLLDIYREEFLKQQSSQLDWTVVLTKFLDQNPRCAEWEDFDTKMLQDQLDRIFNNPARQQQQQQESREEESSTVSDEQDKQSSTLVPMHNLGEPLHFRQPVRVHAKVIDFWAGGSMAAAELRNWLAESGFDVRTDFSSRQVGVSCGYIAAQAATRVYLEHQNNPLIVSGWHEMDLSDCADYDWVELGNRILHGTMGDTNPTELTVDEVSELVSHWTADPNLAWFQCCSKNYITTIIRNGAEEAVSEKKKIFRVAVVNTSVADESSLKKKEEVGHHWFTVAYSINAEPIIVVNI